MKEYDTDEEVLTREENTTLIGSASSLDIGSDMCQWRLINTHDALLPGVPNVVGL
jgi:hypothetical protein